MGKKLNIEYGGEKFVLEYTRKTVSMLEAQGFRVDSITETPMSSIPSLFFGAFLAHHPTMSKSKADGIWDCMPNKNDLIGKLAEMYAEPISTLLAEPEENEGNALWTGNW